MALTPRRQCIIPRPAGRGGVLHWLMILDVIDLRDFYSRRLGIVARG